MFGIFKKKKGLLKCDSNSDFGLKGYKNNEDCLRELWHKEQLLILRPLPAFIYRNERIKRITIKAFSVITINLECNNGFCEAHVSYCKEFVNGEYHDDEENIYREDISKVVYIDTNLLKNCALRAEPRKITSSDNSFWFYTCRKYFRFSQRPHEERYFIMCALYISCLTMFHIEAAKAFAPGLNDVMEKTLEELGEDYDDSDEKSRLIREVTSYMREVYKTMVKMDALLDVESLDLIKITQDEKEKKEQEILKQERIKIEKTMRINSLLDQINARKELLCDFNKPIISTEESDLHETI